MKTIKLFAIVAIIAATTSHAMNLNIADLFSASQLKNGIEQAQTRLAEFKQQQPEASIASVAKDSLTTGLATAADNIDFFKTPLHVQLAAAAFGLLKNPTIALTLFTSQFNRSTDPVMKAFGEFLTQNRSAIQTLLAAATPLISNFGTALINLKNAAEAKGGLTPELIRQTKEEILASVQNPALLADMQAKLETHAGLLDELANKLQNLVLP